MKYSNCLFEALKAKLANWREVEICVEWKTSIPHWYWVTDQGFCEFKAHDRNLPLWKVVYFKGYYKRTPFTKR